MTDCVSLAYQNGGALLSLDTDVLHPEPDHSLGLDDLRGVLLGDEGPLFVRVAQLRGDLRVGDEGLARAHLDLDAHSLHARHHAVQHLPLQRTVH